MIPTLVAAQLALLHLDSKRAFLLLTHFSAPDALFCGTVGDTREQGDVKGAVLREKQYLPLPKDAIHVGLDPGIINPIDLAWRLEEHTPVQRMTYTAKEHYEAGHINSVAKKHEARVQRLA